MRLPSLIGLLLASSVLAAADVRACSCVQVSPEAALAEHAAVFEGRVLAVEPAADPSHPLRATLEVVQHWKGVETERALVSTGAMESLCGVAFEVGTSWLVYADREGDALSTGLCSRTRRIEDAEEDLAALGAGVVPVEIGEDDEVEPPAERAPPARGGCASCTIGGPAPTPRAAILAPLGALAVAGARRRARTRG